MNTTMEDYDITSVVDLYYVSGYIVNVSLPNTFVQHLICVIEDA